MKKWFRKSAVSSTEEEKRISYFNFNLIRNGEPFSIGYHDGRYCWGHNGEQIVLPEYDRVSMAFAVSNDCVFALRMSGQRPIPYELKVYSLDGEYLWDVGEIARSISSRQDCFTSVQVHTKVSLSQYPWSSMFGGCDLCADHEYLSAFSFDGEQWLFDITDRKFIKKYFTK